MTESTPTPSRFALRLRIGLAALVVVLATVALGLGWISPAQWTTTTTGATRAALEAAP